MSNALAIFGPEAVADEPKPAQFTLTRLQLINWGTFSGFWEATISPQGHLITGESGHGKSTLLDAMSAVMFAPKDLDFNAAARDAITKGRDRTLLTYVRGAYAQRPDEEGNAAVQFLRTGSTWSAVSLEFAHPERGTVTLVRVFRASESTGNVEQLTKVAMILERSFDLRELEDVVRVRLDSGVLKRKFEASHVGPDFGPYQERYMRLFGIESDRALQLLQKTQAMKGLNTLDGLMRDFMLDEPETFTHAERAVDQFGNLRAAYTAIQNARKQRDRLLPIIDHAATMDDAAQSKSNLECELAGIERFKAERSLSILQRDLTAAEEARARATANIASCDNRLGKIDEEIAGLRHEYHRAGGGDLHDLDAAIARLANDHSKTVARRTQFASAIEPASYRVPSTRDEFTELTTTVREELRRSANDTNDRKSVVYTAHDRVSDASKSLAAAERELKSLNLRPSNVPARLDDLRNAIARACSIPADQLPFVAETLQVRPDEEKWAGAIERVLGGFALAIMVPRKFYRTFTEHVDTTNLKNRIEFYPIDPDGPVTRSDTSAGSLVSKLDVAPGLFRNWVVGRLLNRFDYQCVDSVADLEKHTQAVTINGLQRGRGDRHVKDDRSHINNRNNWVLGFDNAEKKALYEASVERLTAALEVALQARAVTEEAEASLAARQNILQRILDQDWDDIDTQTTLRLLDAQQRARDTILNGNPDLDSASLLLNEAERRRASEQERRTDAVGAKAVATAHASGITTDLRELRDGINDLPTAMEGIGQAIEARFEQLPSAPTIKQLGEAVNDARTAIQSEIEAQRARGNDARNHLIGIFSRYLMDWGAQASEVDATLDSLPDFLGILDTLQRDRLPEFEEEFRKLMHEGPSRHLTDLSRKLDEERRAIDRRIEPINDALATTEYNRGTHLEIIVTDTAPPALHQFKRDLRAFAQANALAPEDTAEDRYEMLSAIIGKLGGDAASDLAWKQQVLDVRRHVVFAADEKRGDIIVDRHTTGNGRSGGQRVKLVTFTLAAALRYQLTEGYSGEVPVFAPVIIDEAFSKADDQFTEQSLQVFKTFGFQLILATPNKMLTTFQHFIGAATIVHRSDDSHLSSLLPIRMEKVGAVEPRVEST